MNWLLIGSTVLTVIFLILYIAHIIRRHKLEKAIFEIRDLLRDIKDEQNVPVARQSESTKTVPSDPEDSSAA